jgi:alpha-glucoside transport system permease protein
MGTQSRTQALIVNGVLLLLVILWSIPTLGLFISSFRDRFDIQISGWWTVFPHREWQTITTLDPKELGLDPQGEMTVEGVTGTFEEMREGLQSGEVRVTWVGNRRLGRIEVQEQVWTVNWNFTLDNYRQVIGGTDREVTLPDGTVEVVPGQDMSQAFLNSMAVTIPSTPG